MLQSDAIESAASGGNIFVSYSWNDRDFTQQIIALLKDEGYDPQVDRTDIAPSEAWRSRLSEMIASCDTFLFVLTDDWVTSQNCKSEFDEALSAGKRLIPVVPRALTLTPPDEIGQLNYIYFFNLQPGDGRGFYEGMGELKRALRYDLERLRLRRRYEDRANGWAAGEDDLLTGDQLSQAETWLKREMALEGVPEHIARYIAASQSAREAAERRATRNRRILATLGSFALVASVIAAGVAWFAYQSVNLADRDSELLTEAARYWADGKGSLVSNVREQDLDESERLLTTATETLMNGLSTVSQIDRDAVKPLRVEIAIDLASAHLNAARYREAFAELNFVDDLVPLTSEETQATFQLAMAFIACQDGIPELAAGETGARAVLSATPEALHPLLTSSRVNTWRAPHPQCDGMPDALCVYEDSCADEMVIAGPPPSPPPPAPEPREPSPREPVRIDDAETEAPATPAPGVIGMTDEELEQLREEDERAAQEYRVIETVGPYQITEVYLHISEESQRADARRLAAGLEQLGYDVLGIELVPAPPGRNRSVRYFYGQQADQAMELREICTELGAEIGRGAWADPSTYRVISLEGRYKGLPQDRVEIWL
ncbi:MAG: toll/interleukin-1 receptor domain-containing protein [Pseudomonadota bacterium]